MYTLATAPSMPTAVRTDIVPICNMGEQVLHGSGSSAFCVRLWDPVRNVSHVELSCLAVPPPPLDGVSSYVQLTIPELKVSKWPVFYRCMHFHEAGNTYTLDCNPKWHFLALQVPIGVVERLTVFLTHPDDTPLKTPSEIALLLRLTHCPRQEILPMSMPSRKQTKLVMLDISKAQTQPQPDSYDFVTSLDEQPFYDIESVRLLGIRMPPLFLQATKTWEPYLHLHIPELNIEWTVQHTWYYTDHDIVDWCVLPEYHCVAHMRPPVTTTRLSVQLLSSIATGKPHIVTRHETCDKLKCSILLQITSRHVPF